MKSRIVTALHDWYCQEARDLPWREKAAQAWPLEQRLYYVLVSEVMLQQTQVKTVIPYFKRFMEKFPTMKALAQASLEDVYRYFAGLGYYARARRMHATAQAITDKGVGKSLDDYHALPGLGPYTAAALWSLGHYAIVGVVDTNVRRVLTRIFFDAKELCDFQPTPYHFKPSAMLEKKLQTLANTLAEKAHGLNISSSVHNQAMMELGASLCRSTDPKCSVCPVSTYCRAYKLGVVSHIRIVRLPVAVKKIEEERFAYVTKDGRLYLEPSPVGAWRQGLWDAPTQAHFKGKLRESWSSRHIVTSHKIYRTTHIIDVADAITKKVCSGQWVHAHQDHFAVPIGAPIKALLKYLFYKMP